MSTSRSPECPEAAAPSLPPLELPGLDPGLCSPVTRSSGLTRRLLHLQAHGSLPRRKRQMVPTDKKDAAYWDKRQKNNQAAKRSREKRRLSDLMLEGRLLALRVENAQLRGQLLQLQYHSSLRAVRGYSAACQASESTFIPRTPYAPSLPYTGMWGNTKSNRVTGLGDWHRAAAARPPETMIPRSIPHPQALNTFGAQQGIPALSDPCVLSLGAGLEVGSSAEAQMKGQRQITISENIRSPPSIRMIPDFFPQAPLQPHSWPKPHGEPSALCKSFLLPLKSPYMSPPGVHTVLPDLYAQGEQAGVPVRGQTLRESSGGVSAALHQLGVQLSPTGC